MPWYRTTFDNERAEPSVSEEFFEDDALATACFKEKVIEAETEEGAGHRFRKPVRLRRIDVREVVTEIEVYPPLPVDVAD